MLRWWAPAGFGVFTDSADYSNFRASPVVAKIQGVRCVLIAGNDVIDDDPDLIRQPVLRIFRFHPCSSVYDPATTIAPTLMKIELGSAAEDSASAERVESAPLVLSNDKVIVQTTRRVLCYDLSSSMVFDPNDCDPQTPPSPYWVFDPSGDFVSSAASPTTGKDKESEGGAYRIYVMGIKDEYAKLVALDPATGANGNPFLWERTIGSDVAQPAQCPAIGPIDGDEDERNFVYCPRLYGGDPEFQVVIADNTGSPNIQTAAIDDLRAAGGTFASASVHPDNGECVVGSDDYGFYSFDNVIGMSDVIPYRDATPTDTGTYISCTAGLFPDRRAIFWNEGGVIHRILDSGSSQNLQGTYELDTGKGWEWGAPALDAAGRFYVNTVGTGDDPDGQQVHAFLNDNNGFSELIRAWQNNTYVPPTITISAVAYNLQQDFEAAIAIDEDGTLICANRGYVLALRPLLGDLNGDGCVNECDVDAFVTALVDPEEYDATFGAGFGAVNRLGVCDCNNDGVCDNYDIDCFENLAEAPVECSDGYEEQECEGEGQGFGPGGSSWDHFYEMMDFLRGHFGMI